MTSMTTRPAVPSGPTIGPSQLKPANAEAASGATTTGRETVPFGGVDVAKVPLDVLDRVLELLDRAALPAPRTSAIFVRMFAR